MEALALQAKDLINVRAQRDCVSKMSRYRIRYIVATAYRRFVIEKFKSDGMGYLPPPEGLSATISVKDLSSLGVYSVPRRSMGPTTATGWTMRVLLSRWADELAGRYGVDEREIGDRLLQLGDEFIEGNAWTLPSMTTQRQDEVVRVSIRAVQAELEGRVLSEGDASCGSGL